MSYLDRLQKQITLTSPKGLIFEAKWIGDDRSLEKRLGIFKTPGVDGVIVQDLATESTSYPLTFFFDGSDNDLESGRFFEACKETGQWEIIHPVYGAKTLQLVSVSQAIQPVTSGGVTEITTEWLEVKPSVAVGAAFGEKSAAGVKSVTQLSAETIAQSAVLAEISIEQFSQIVELDTADKVGKLKVATENTVSSFSNTLESITATVAEVQAQVESIKKGIDETVFGPLTDVIALAGQIQALIALPQQIFTDIKSKIETFSRFKDQILGKLIGASSPANVNTAAVQELALSAALGAIGVSSVVTPLTSKQVSIDAVEANQQFFDEMIDGLDAIQELYAGQLLINSYFSQSQSFADASKLVAGTLAYLMQSSFALATEKRITLIRAENPVMIAMREYQGPGENDSNIDLFYVSNELAGQETLLLPAGKEVVVYLAGA